MNYFQKHLEFMNYYIIFATNMINQQLLNPESIVVIGGSNNVHKPGGSIVRNLINGGYSGTLRIVNPKEDEVQGIKAFHDVKDLPDTELAILVVAARFCPDYVAFMAKEKQTRAFIIISAGFGEETKRLHVAHPQPESSGRGLRLRLWRHCRVYP